MDIKVQMPPVFGGTQEIYSYLFQMAQTINAANDSIQTRTDKQVADAIVAAGTVSQDRSSAVAQNLRALIINTANTINAAIDQTEIRLGARIKANSDRFGNLDSTVEQAIISSAESTVQQFSKTDLITGIQNSIEGLTGYRERTEGYIKSGFIDVDEAGRPVLGIAIGQQLESTVWTDESGTQYNRFKSDTNCAFYTADRVSFRINGKEIAYFSNKALHCGNLEATGTVTLGGKWQIDSAGALTIRWAGD